MLVVSKKGKILGVSKSNKVREISELITESVGSHIDNMLNERLLSVLSTKENVNLETLGFSSDAVEGCQAIITPIDIAGERLGTLFIYKQDATYSIDDIILSEYGTAVVGLEMLRSVNEEVRKRQEKNMLFRQQSAHFLSQSWKQSFISLKNLMVQRESIWLPARWQIVWGLQGSVIVNALRKFESAGVIESRSSGMKGTYIKVLNDYVFTELERIEKERM